MDNQYKGMTLNERLYVSGLMKDFDIAVKNKDMFEIRKILKEVEIEDELAIKQILNSVGLKKDPSDS